MAKEIERKFLVRGEGWRNAAGSARRLRQAYLAITDRVVVRVRLAGDEQAWLTVKSAGASFVRDEFEYDIPPPDARELLALCATAVVDKTRHPIAVGGQEWTVDEFHGENAGLVLAEVELSREDEKLERPGWLGEDVTGDPRYVNQALAQHPFSRWPRP